MFAAPPSCRQTTSRIARVVQRVEQREVALAGHAERGVDGMHAQLVGHDAAAGAYGHGSSMGSSSRTVALCSSGSSSSAGSR